MKYIWDKVSKPSTESTRRIRYKDRKELEYLYQTGFVDTDQFSLDQWIAAFQDSLQPDGSYLLAEGQWMQKKKYRYAEPIDDPFDPLILREGLWEPTEFEKLLKEKILPSITVDEGTFRMLLKKERAKHFVDGKFKMDLQFKLGLIHILELAPSPRRFREIQFAGARARIVSGGGATSPSMPSIPSVQQPSSFQMGPPSSKTAVDQLSKLLWKGK